MPDGSTSCTKTPVAMFGPLFVTLTVYVTVSPTFGCPLLTRLAIAKSADWTTTTTLSVLFAWLLSA